MEIWKNISGYGGDYQVSNYGNIRSFKTKSKGNKLTPAPNKQKYLLVGLSEGGVVKLYYVHRLVALAFVPNPESKPEVNHKNGIKKDNRATNLEWCTPVENLRHAYKTGLKNHTGVNHPRSKLNDFQVRVIRKCTDLKQRELAEIFNVSQVRISSIQTRKTWKHII